MHPEVDPGWDRPQPPVVIGHQVPVTPSIPPTACHSAGARRMADVARREDDLAEPNAQRTTRRPGRRRPSPGTCQIQPA